MRKTLGLLFNIKGNAKACLYTEPMWAIPFQLYMPFVSLYMHHLGLLDIEIGIILAVGRLFQMVMALFGGIITDKLGRHKTTFYADCISWSIPALIWAFSQNFWWFFIAAVVNSASHITTVSWECLWVDDTEESQVGPIFNWIYISGLLAVFFAPIAGYFVQIHGVVPVMRVLYLITFVIMTAKFVILYVYSTETKRGLERIEATRDIPVSTMLSGYIDVFKLVKNSRVMVRALAMQAVIGAILPITTTFFALYVTQDLFIPEAFLAYFPILRAGIMLAFLLVIQEWFNRFKTRRVMLMGLGLYIFSMIWLIASPAHNWIWLSAYVIMDAVAAALLLPRVDALVTNAMDPQERARIRSLFNTVILAVSAPFGFIAGVLSDMDRRLPFALNLILFVVVVFVALSRTRVYSIKR